MTNPSSWSHPEGQSHTVSLPSQPLPSWAKTYRTVLMVIGGVGLVALAAIVVSFSLPANMDDPAGLRGVDFGIMTSLFYAAGSIPYLIANGVYAICWASSLRGRGYSVSGLSSVFLVTVPVLVAASILRGIAMLWWQ